MVQFSLLAVGEVVVVIALALLVDQFLEWALIKHVERAGASHGQRVTVRRGIRGMMALFAVIAILDVLGVESQLEALTFAGIAALILGLAFQSTLAGAVSGLIVFAEDRIRLGDVVEVRGAGKGRVVKAKVTNFWIKTDSGALLVLGSTELDKARYWNYTAAKRLKKQFDA